MQARRCAVAKRSLSKSGVRARLACKASGRGPPQSERNWWPGPFQSTLAHREPTTTALSEMNTQDYTPNAICQSLGLGAFDEPWVRGKPQRQLRLLLCPSFGPELCMTFTEVENALTVAVASARTQIWTMPSLGLVTVDHSKSALPETSFQEIESAFRRSLAVAPQSVVMIDGMPIHAVCRNYGTGITISDNPGRAAPFGQFSAQMIQLAYSVTANVGCRNGLAGAGRYVGLDLPIEPEAELGPVTRVMVLGDREEQGEVLAALAAVAGRKPRTSK